MTLHAGTVYRARDPRLGRDVAIKVLLEGETLREMAVRRAPSQRQVLSFAVQVAEGLAAAHARGIVHRDVKPENVFVTTDGRVMAKLDALSNLRVVCDPTSSTGWKFVIGPFNGWNDLPTW